MSKIKINSEIGVKNKNIFLFKFDQFLKDPKIKSKK
jgi:hypothetical protein